MKKYVALTTVGTVVLSGPFSSFLAGSLTQAHAAQTFTGDPANSRRGGQVEVAITVDAGKITAVATPMLPGGGNTQWSSYAAPILIQETLKAQSANINSVSGASLTSAAFIQSLQSAVAKAGAALGGTAPTPTAVATPTPTAVATPTPTPTQVATPTPAKTTQPTQPPTRQPGPRQSCLPAQGFRSTFAQPAAFHRDDEQNPFGEGDDHGYNNPYQGGPNQSPYEGRGDNRRLCPTPIPTQATKITPTPTPTPTLAPTHSAAATPTPSDSPIVLKPGASVIKKTVTCTKGKTVKKISGFNPICPPGYVTTR